MTLEDRIRRVLRSRASAVQAGRDGWTDLEERLEGGPSYNAQSPGAGRPIRRLATVVLAFAVFLAAGVFAWDAFKSGPVQPRPVNTATYPSPPASGYWILLPDHPQPIPGDPQTVEIDALTNLPEGTVVWIFNRHVAGCCQEVRNGQIQLSFQNFSCLGYVGDIGNSPGFSIRINVSTYVEFALGGKSGSPLPDRQPDSVLAVLGQHFEHLTGEHVLRKDGRRTLVAAAHYRWPEPQCGPGPIPLFGGPTCDPIPYNYAAPRLRGAMGEVIGDVATGRMCHFWAVTLPADVQTQHPWPEFAAEWRHWFFHPRKDFTDAEREYGNSWPLMWHLRSHQGNLFWVDVTDHGQLILSLTLAYMPDVCQGCIGTPPPEPVPYWGVLAWTLH